MDVQLWIIDMTQQKSGGGSAVLKFSSFPGKTREREERAAKPLPKSV
jgi:hypothetical protein